MRIFEIELSSVRKKCSDRSLLVERCNNIVIFQQLVIAVFSTTTATTTKKQRESPDFIPITRQLKINNNRNSSWKILWTTELLSMYIHIRMQNNISIIMSLVVLCSSSSLAVIPSRIITRCYF
jgi:hypothetical protein